MPKVGQTPKKLTVDFTGVDRGGGGVNPRLPAGDYLSQVIDCKLASKRDDPSKKNLRWSLKVLEGNAKGVGKTIRNTTALSAESLWSLRGFLMDLLGEENVPQRSVDVPIAKIVRSKPKIGITLEDDEYNGKATSKVSATFPASDWADLKGAATAEDEDEDEDDEEEEDTEEEEDDEEEDDEDEEEEVKPKKKTKKVEKAVKSKKTKKSKKPVVDDDDEDEDDEDEIDVDEL